MYEYKTIIDSNGYVIERCVLFKDGEPQEFTLEEGQQVVEYLNKTHIINDTNVEYYKPQYVNGVWIETATQDELNLVYPPISLDELKQNKINKLDLTCKNKIYYEFYSSADGTSKLYDLDTDHQVRLSTKKFEILFAQSQGKTVEPILYYSKGEDCHDYTAEQFLQLVQDAENWITNNTTKYKNLKTYVLTLTTSDEINAVTFDTEIPS